MNEEALVTNCFEGWPRHRECRSNIVVCGLASRVKVHQPAVSISFRRRKSRRQELRLNHFRRDFAERDFFAGFRISLCAHSDVDWWFGQLSHILRNACRIDRGHTGDSGGLEQPVLHVHVLAVSVCCVLALRRDACVRSRYPQRY